MRQATSSLSLFALLFAGAAMLACGGKTQSAADTTTTDSTPAAAPAPPAESYDVVAEDGSWQVDITPAGIVWRKTKGKKDSLVFDYKAPQVDGALSNYQVIRTAPDTHTIAIRLAMVPCTDKSQKSYTHMAQVWVDQVAYSGCAVKK